MAKYKVIRTFKDLADNKHLYRVGDTYPRDGVSPTKARIDELLTANNKRNQPMISKIVEKSENSQEEKPKKTRKKLEE